MLKALLTLMATVLGWTSAVQAQCPDVRNRETAFDCPWADATRATSQLRDHQQIRALIEQKIPGFIAHIEKDAQSRELLSLWSLSRNIDESHLGDGKLTVPANLLSFFNSIFKVPYNSEFTVGHAGLTHTYGYLFSNLSTPFGFKRARYVAGEIESGFGLEIGLFSGMPSRGTLLSNLTAFVAPIAFRDSATARADYQAVINSRKTTMVPEIAYYSRSHLKVKRLVEVVSTDTAYLELRTDIVNFSHKNKRGSNQALLIYSIDFRKPNEPSRPRLVTVFPVDGGFANGIFNPKNLGDNVGIKIKYNAMLPVQTSGKDMVGKRYIEE